MTSRSAMYGYPSRDDVSSPVSGGFSATFRDSSDNPILFTNVSFRPLNYSSTALGGEDQAEIGVLGTEEELYDVIKLLGREVVIRSPLGRKVWIGLVEAVEVSLPAITIGASLRDMYNRVSVQYTRSVEEKIANSYSTDWLQDDDSVTRYGKKEIRVPLNESNKEQAEARRGTLLAALKSPSPTVSITEGELTGRVMCIGYFYRLGWSYFENDTGYLKNEANANIEEALGWGYVSSQIAFRDKELHDLGMGLSNLPSGGQLLISGSAANNRTVTIDSVPKTTLADQFTSTDHVQFRSLDDVYIGNFLDFEAGELIGITGSDSNNGYYWIKSIKEDRFEISGGTIVNEDRDSTWQTITQGHHLTVEDANFVVALPGAAVTLHTPWSLAQKIVPTGTFIWQDFVVRVGRVGVPTDLLSVSIVTDSGGPSTTTLGSGTIAPDQVKESSGWVECRFPTAVALTSGTTYWLVVKRTGSYDPVNFWLAGVSSNCESGNIAKIWDPVVGWFDHPGGVDLPFQAWATEDTAEMVERIFGTLPFIKTTQRRALAGVRTRIYRDGSKRVDEEIKDLVESGDSTQRRLLIWFEGGANAVIDLEPTKSSNLRFSSDGDLIQAPSTPWEEGLLPVRQWVDIQNLPPGEIFSSFSPFFVETARFDVENRSLSLEPKSARTVWDE